MGIEHSDQVYLAGKSVYMHVKGAFRYLGALYSPDVELFL